MAIFADEGVGAGEVDTDGFADAHVVVFGEDFAIHLLEELIAARAVGPELDGVFAGHDVAQVGGAC